MAGQSQDLLGVRVDGIDAPSVARREERSQEELTGTGRAGNPHDGDRAGLEEGLGRQAHAPRGRLIRGGLHGLAHIQKSGSSARAGER